MAYVQAQPASRSVYLSLSGSAATAVTYSSVTVHYRKEGQTSFTTKTLASVDWVNLGNGFYAIKFSAGELSTVGDFMFTMTSAGFDDFKFDQFTIEPLVIPNVVVQPTQCIVSGTVFNISALPPTTLRVTARPVQFPARDGNNIMASDAIFTFPDSQGNFTLTLVRNSLVMIEIERAGIKAQITVPNSSTANLIDLLPAFVVDYSQPS